MDSITLSIEKANAPEYSDTEMLDTTSGHHLSVKQEELTPSRPARRIAPYADLYLNTYAGIKSEIKDEIKSETAFEVNLNLISEGDPQTGYLESPHLTDNTDEAKEDELVPEEAKKPRRKPTKTPREYHQRKQQDSAAGIRKARKIDRQIDSKKFLQSLAKHDQVSAYNSGPNTGAAPIMVASTKKSFMQEILAQCPENDWQKFRTELNILDEESRSFGFRRMEMKNGMWMLKGMKSR
jgi:hypothetical protein